MIDTATFKDYVSLMYHESRNVRHLVRGNHISSEGWESIMSLPTNREDAWRVVNQFATSLPNDAPTVLSKFADRFGRNLDQLIVLFENENWRHARNRGGHAWARIGSKVRTLAEALTEGKTERAKEIEQDLQMERHNTGTVQNKLAALRSAIP